MPNDEHSEGVNGGDGVTAPEESGLGRRRLLTYGGLLALLGALGVGAGLRALDDDTPQPDASTPTATPAPTGTPAESDDLWPLVERYAPDLYFGRRERWFPTDPRPYASEVDGTVVVDGFDALSAYTREFRDSGTPPRPTVFYNVAPIERSQGGAVVALQYWMYSVFDQFSVNFHWHDWELLQAFVEVETGEPILLSASAHARSCPNNEFFRPPEDRPVVLAEVGSHSSATDVNGSRSSFERLAVGPLAADVSNAFLRPLDSLVEQPFAYGLPRDEGASLPYALPDLDGVPLPDHPALPGVGASDFVDADVTVRSWGDLLRPPGDLPAREPGTVITAPGSEAAGDAAYELVPLSDVASAIDGFTGPQLSFEFSIPGFVEDRVADHITTAGIPWEDPRLTDPVGDVTDPAHRRALDGAEPAGLSNRVVGAVTTLLGRSDGQLPGVPEEDRDGLDPYVPVSVFPLPIEVACLLLSDPVATVTAGGVFRFLHVEPGAHELVVNGPGLAPYAERFQHGGGTVRPGVDGRVTVVANEDAVVLRADRRDATGISRVRVVEDLAGPVYDAAPVEGGRFAIPVHREGNYTVGIVDGEGVAGAVRVDPARLDGEPIPQIAVGKAALAEALAEFLFEAWDVAEGLANGQGSGGGREGNSEGGSTASAEFAAAARDASLAGEVALEGDALGANEVLERVVERLVVLRQSLADDDAYTDAAASLLRHRAADGIDRAETAYATPIVG